MDLITPDFGLFFWMIVSFSLVFVILRKFAWKPIVLAINEREKNIEEGLIMAEKAKTDLEQLHEKSEIIISEANIEKESIIKKGRETKEQIIEEAKEQAKTSSREILEVARKRIEEEKEAAIEQMKEQVSAASIEIAEKILREKLTDEKTQKKLMEHYLNDFSVN